MELVVKAGLKLAIAIKISTSVGLIGAPVQLFYAAAR